MKIDGRAIAENIFTDLKRRVNSLKKKGITPHLVIILIGDDSASKAYVRQKVLKGEAIGANVTVKNYELRITNYELRKTIEQLNNDNNVHGIIVQRPLPPHIDEKAIDEAVDSKKDVDGFHPQTPFQMPLAAAVLRILQEIHIAKAYDVADFREWLASKNIVVVGKGKTGGGPIIQKLKSMHIEPTIVDSKTHNPQLITRNADILISAVGKPRMIRKDWLRKDYGDDRPGTILISVGMHKGEDGKLHGDYDEDDIKDVTTFYTPTPGGVGPVNVAMLLQNVVKAAESFAS